MRSPGTEAAGSLQLVIEKAHAAAKTQRSQKEITWASVKHADSQPTLGQYLRKTQCQGPVLGLLNQNLQGECLGICIFSKDPR